MFPLCQEWLLEMPLCVVFLRESNRRAGEGWVFHPRSVGSNPRSSCSLVQPREIRKETRDWIKKGSH